MVCGGGQASEMEDHGVRGRWEAAWLRWHSRFLGVSFVLVRKHVVVLDIGMCYIIILCLL